MENEFKGSKAFLMIPPSISRDEDLLRKPKSILLMGEIISMLNVTGEFFMMSNQKIAEHLKVSGRQVNRYLDLLEKKKLIEREKVVSDKNGAILGRKIHAGSALMTC
ncbi:MAG: helix-turn-helix domain-containing protein, partial [Lactobacillus crispatus]|nr:helix-turn-helix domain-containing protein [Lactobacillus crispatus]